jgi:competence protein ComEC
MLLYYALSYLFGTSWILICSNIYNQTIYISYVLSLVSGILAYKKRSQLLICLTCFCLGSSLAMRSAQHSYQQRLPFAMEQHVQPLDGYIDSIPSYSRYATQFIFASTQYGRVQLQWGKPHPPIALGQHWQLSARLQRPRGFANHGSFDSERYATQQHLHASGKVIANTAQAQDYPWQFYCSPKLITHILRNALYQRCWQQLQHDESGGLLLLLGLGITNHIAPTHKQLLQSLGLGHMLSISGMHLATVWGGSKLLATVCLRYAGQYLSMPRILVTNIIAFATTSLYALLVGLPLATQRAWGMLLVITIYTCFQKPRSGSEHFAATLCTMLLLDPLIVLNRGFWLSFTAVAALLYGYTNRLGSEPNKYWRYFKAQWLLFWGLLPCQSLWFPVWNVSALLHNLLLVPYINGLILPGALCSIWLPAIAKLTTRCCHGLWWLATKLERCNYCITLASPSLIILYALGVSVLWVLAPAGIPGRKLAASIVIMTVCYHPPIQEPPLLTVTILDIGQGLSAVIQTKKHTLLYDSGPLAGKQVLLPFLNDKKIRHLDKVIISHADSDHVNGLHDLLLQLPIQQIITPQPALLAAIAKSPLPAVQPCIAGSSWLLDDLEFMWLHPQQESLLEPSIVKNNQSCVLKISTAHGSILFTGDIDIQIEQELITRWGKQLQSNILIVPHHGSKHGSSPAFLQTVAPQYAIASTGYLNRYRHPHAVQERYQAIACPLLNTAKLGSIQVSFYPQRAPSVESFRKTYRHWWQE